MDTKNEKDLFLDIKNQPKNLQAIVNKYLDISIYSGLTYQDCKNFLIEVDKIGYTFSYGLDAQPYNLKKL